MNKVTVLSIFLSLASFQTFSLTLIDGNETKCNKWDESSIAAKNLIFSCKGKNESKDIYEF